MKIKIEFEIDIPEDGYSPQELEDFLMFTYSGSGKLSRNNPLLKVDTDPVFGTFKWNYAD